MILAVAAQQGAQPQTVRSEAVNSGLMLFLFSIFLSGDFTPERDVSVSEDKPRDEETRRQRRSVCLWGWTHSGSFHTEPET